MKISKSDKRLLLEAYQRWHLFGRDNKEKTLETAWLGLGFPSEYGESRFFQPHGTLIPRALNWWVLSKEGVEVMNTIIKLHPWKQTFEHVPGRYLIDELFSTL